MVILSQPDYRTSGRSQVYMETLRLIMNMNSLQIKKKSKLTENDNDAVKPKT